VAGGVGKDIHADTKQAGGSSFLALFRDARLAFDRTTVSYRVVTDDVYSRIEDIEDVPRGAEEIARRVLILGATIGCAFGAEKRDAIAWLRSEGLWIDVSPEEAAFLSRKHTQQQKIDMTWRIEALVPLLWVLRKIDVMPSLAEQFDIAEADSLLVFSPAPIGSFVLSASLRAASEIEEEYEKVYQAHWQVRDARLFGRTPPADINASVVQERHHAFNWIVGYGNQTWDEISTDT
jgi:hypothetical protein